MTLRTEIIQNDANCNYLDLQSNSASQILHSCINNPQATNDGGNGALNPSITTIEPFSSDMPSTDGGVSYVPKNTCHDGYSKNENGICVQKWRGRERDGNWQRGHHNETMHDGKDNYEICGKGNKFLGLDKGYIRCEITEKGKELLEKEVLGWDSEYPKEAIIEGMDTTTTPHWEDINYP